MIDQVWGRNYNGAGEIFVTSPRYEVMTDDHAKVFSGFSGLEGLQTKIIIIDSLEFLKYLEW